MTHSDPHIFRNRSFAVFWLSRVVGNLAFQMQVVAVGWQVYVLTGDPFDLGLVGLIQFLPSLFLLLIAGQVADRYNRIRIVLISRLVLASAIGVLALTTALGVATREIIFGVVFCIGCAHAFQMPTSQAIVPNLVSRSLLPKAIAWSSIGFQGASIVGLAIGGFMFVAGAAFVFTVCFVLYLVSALLVLMVKLNAEKVTRQPVTRETLFAGFAFIRVNPVLLGAISLDLCLVLLGGATALMPIFAEEILAAGPTGLGLLRAAPGVGALSTAAFFAIKPLRRRVGRWLFASAGGFGLATIVFGLSSSFTLSLLALVILGAVDMVNVVIRQSIVQLDTPDHMRGRVGAVSSLFIGGSNQLGEFESGVTAAWWGIVPAVVFGGFGALAVAVLWIFLFPALWNRDKISKQS